MKKTNSIPNKKLRILTIDGGGAKAYFTAYAIKKLKEEFDINLLDHFDLFVGTSSGALIIAILLFGISPDQLYYIYDHEGEKLFQRESFFSALTSPLFAQYSNEYLVKELKTLFGDLTFKQLYEKSNRSFIITATNFNEAKPIIFASPNISRLNLRYQRYLVREAVQASTAAPFYFAPFSEDITGDWIIDGGTWSNNPSIVGLMYGLSHFKSQVDDIEMLSFGQTFIEDLNFKPVKGRDLLRNFKSNELSVLYSTTLISQMNFYNLFATKLLEENYFRYSPNMNFNDSKINGITPEFKEYAHQYYEKTKLSLVEFIKNGSNHSYNKKTETRYN